MYFFVIIFALVSLLQDEKIKSVLSIHYNKTRKRFYKRVEKESIISEKIDNNPDYEQKFF
jgi:hypothetical protein